MLRARDFPVPAGEGDKLLGSPRQNNLFSMTSHTEGN